MKKLLASLFILAAFCVACRAQSLVFDNQTITVSPENLSVESVEFQPLEIVTNSVAEWVTNVETNTGAATSNYAVEVTTNRTQVITDVVTTNAATWICNVRFDLPKGHQWSLNGFPVSIRRFSTLLEVPVDPATVSATFGAASVGLEFAAQNGAYTPTGQVKDAFLSFAAAVLAGGAE